jgi:hypothetical protein
MIFPVPSIHLQPWLNKIRLSLFHHSSLTSFSIRVLYLGSQNILFIQTRGNFLKTETETAEQLSLDFHERRVDTRTKTSN